MDILRISPSSYVHLQKTTLHSFINLPPPYATYGHHKCSAGHLIATKTNHRVMRTPPHWSSHILCIMISNTLIHIIEDIWYVYCLIYRVSQNKVTNRKLVIKPVHRAFWWNRQPPPFHEVFRQCSRFYPDTPKIMRFFSSANNVMNATIGTI